MARKAWGIRPAKKSTTVPDSIKREVALKANDVIANQDDRIKLVENHSHGACRSEG